jgi:hypothetical protein
MKTFKLLLKSLISNDACIEGGRHKPWFFAVIIAFLSLILAVLPIMVSQLNTTGAGFVNNTTYGYEVGLLRFNETIYDNDVNLIVKIDANGNHYLDCETREGQTNNEWNTTFATTPANRFEHRNPTTGAIDFCAYFTTTTGSEYSAYVQRIQNGLNPITAEALSGSDSSRYTSFIVFSTFKIHSELFAPNATKNSGTLNGDYTHTAENTNIKNYGCVVVGDKTYDHNSPVGEGYDIYLEGSWKQWKSFFNDSYIENRNTATWQTTLLMLGIDTLLILFMGLMVFILTRGKRNPFRIYTLWDCQKISYWTTFTPGLLAMILGFIFTNYAVMFFILFLGVRVMWMSMRSLRPQQ